ncbi:hypothetical protein I3843_05G185500 [Carya illinoinensis]|nr:hypothetical protein I3843_05G185500 [Carya illinoinensis]
MLISPSWNYTKSKHTERDLPHLRVLLVDCSPYMDTEVLSTGVGYTNLPQSYIERPRLSEISDCEDLPIIDLGIADRSKISDACKSYGFFQVINHGVSPEAVKEMLDVAIEFFSLPVEEKLKLYSDDPSKTVRLSTSFNVKKEKVLLRLHCYPLDKYVPEWPSNPPTFKIQKCTSLKRRCYVQGETPLNVAIEMVVCVCELDGLHPNLKKWLRFSPPDEQVIELLWSKITGNDHEVNFIFEAQHCRYDPRDLRDLCFNRLQECGIKMNYPEWWLFLPIDRNGKRPRATDTGFWKGTGNPMEIKSKSGLNGRKNVLVFHEGDRRQGNQGKRTDWVMHEYSTTLAEPDGMTHPGLKPFVLCRLFCKQKKRVTDRNTNFAGTAVSSSPSTAFQVQTEATSTPQIFYETISTTIPVDCGDKSFSAHAAENQLGEDAATKDHLLVESMISEMLLNDFEILTPSSTSLQNRSTGSSPTTTESFLEEFLEFEIASGLASPAYQI